ncbi:MAG: NTP transferase domain-containing protein [Myxococcales bacterium]|nr:NTP transferase domain-containing protein [Myxococcales bacterium]
MNAGIDQAVILAAGMGTRIRGESQPLPKPLVSVGGLTLLKRTLLTARKAGITRFVVVLGFDSKRVRAAIDGDPDLAGLTLTFVENPDYRLSNGVSVLKARPHVRGEFFLMMADHVVDPAIYRRLQEEPARGGLVLAVDRKLDSIFDMDDATKVRTGTAERIVAIGKTLPEYDAIDTGIFRCDPALFDALARVHAERGDTSLSDGVQALARDGLARVADIGAAWWQDVDTPETRKHAEKLLFASLTKPTDGPVSRHINRRFSKTVTRLLMNTNLVPNHVTAIGLLVGLAAAVVTAFASPAALWLLPLGGVLFQLSSMLDGCDGEIARLKFKHSDRGEWFDSISDDVINLSYQLAVGYALYRLSGEAVWFQIGLASFVLGWVICGSLYRYLLTTARGNHMSFEWSYMDASNTSWFQRFCARFEFIARREGYALLLMVSALIGPVAMRVTIVASFIAVCIIGVQWFTTQLREGAARRASDTTAQVR